MGMNIMHVLGKINFYLLRLLTPAKFFLFLYLPTSLIKCVYIHNCKIDVYVYIENSVGAYSDDIYTVCLFTIS